MAGFFSLIFVAALGAGIYLNWLGWQRYTRAKEIEANGVKVDGTVTSGSVGTPSGIL